MKEHLKLLGYEVKDVVTGFSGIVTSVSFDLYGCVQAIVSPKVDKTQKVGESYWFDAKRLKVIGKEAVMETPTFEKIPGGQRLPAYASLPLK